MKRILLSIFCLGLMCTTPAFAQDKTEAKKPAIKNIKPDQFDSMRKADTNKVVVLDVRTKKEYQEGHIPGSVLIDFNGDAFEEQVAKLDKSKTYLVHCAAGGRSSRACKKMEKLGFTKLYNLEGGMGAWEKAGKPVKK